MPEVNSEGSDIVVRDMTEGDIQDVVALDVKVTGVQPAVAETGVIDSYVVGGLGLSCVAEDERTIIGYLLARLAYTPAPVTGSAWIQLIGVDPDYRRKGVGRQLIDYFHQRCRERGARVMHISVPAQDFTVQEFLRICGFSPVEWLHFRAEV